MVWWMCWHYNVDSLLRHARLKLNYSSPHPNRINTIFKFQPFQYRLVPTFPNTLGSESPQITLSVASQVYVIVPSFFIKSSCPVVGSIPNEGTALMATDGCWTTAGKNRGSMRCIKISRNIRQLIFPAVLFRKKIHYSWLLFLFLMTWTANGYGNSDWIPCGLVFIWTMSFVHLLWKMNADWIILSSVVLFLV